MLAKFERFTCTMNEATLYWHRIATAVMKPYDLKGSTALYFIELYTHPEGMPAAQLASICGRDKADVSREIAQLEKLGYVNRDTSGKRGYRVPIVLSDAGRELAKKISERAEEAVNFIVGSLDDKEDAYFNVAFGKITENLRILSEEVAENAGKDK